MHNTSPSQTIGHSLETEKPLFAKSNFVHPTNDPSKIFARKKLD